MTFTKLLELSPTFISWGALTKNGQYVIVQDGENYTASFKSSPNSRLVPILNYDEPVESFDLAAEACKSHARGN